MKTHTEKNNSLFKFIFADKSDSRVVFTLQSYKYVRIFWYLYVRVGRYGHYSD